MVACSLFVLTAAAAMPRGAALAGAVFPFVAQGTLPNAKTYPCTCRAQGRDFELGERACLRTPNGMRMARCTMVLNNTSWEFSDELCPQSRR